MTLSEIFAQFISDLLNTRWYEYVAVVAGIGSVWFSKKENIWVYPLGLVNTIIYVYLSLEGHLLGEASVNFYYTIMSFTGWYMWGKKGKDQKIVLKITASSAREWGYHLLFFGILYIIIFSALTYFQRNFYPGVIPWADAFASATAFTGMWLMTRKKIESWYWWIATNIASVPLYFVKHYVFTSVYYVILLILAVSGLLEWQRRERERVQVDAIVL